MAGPYLWAVGVVARYHLPASAQLAVLAYRHSAVIAKRRGGCTGGHIAPVAILHWWPYCTGGHVALSAPRGVAVVVRHLPQWRRVRCHGHNRRCVPTKHHARMRAWGEQKKKLARRWVANTRLVRIGRILSEITARACIMCVRRCMHARARAHPTGVSVDGNEPLPVGATGATTFAAPPSACVRACVRVCVRAYVCACVCVCVHARGRVAFCAMGTLGWHGRRMYGGLDLDSAATHN